MLTITLEQYRREVRQERRLERLREHQERLDNLRVGCEWWNQTFARLKMERLAQLTPILPQSAECAEQLGAESAEHLARALHV